MADSAPEQALITRIDLSTDALDKVVALPDPDDELAAALACRKLRDAVCASVSQRRRTLKTRARSLLSSLGKLHWGVACGAPLSAALFSQAARLGDLRMLSWLRARGCSWPDVSIGPVGPQRGAVRARSSGRAPDGAAVAARQWPLPVGQVDVLARSV
jgi:hypothetical protein